MTAFTHPRLNNRPPVTELDEPLRVTAVPEMREAGWVDDLTFDARCELDGLTWYRVRGGFGGRNDREDWVAAVPGSSVSVTGWQLERGNGDVTAGMRQAVADAEVWSHGKVVKARAALALEIERSLILRDAVRAREETA